MNCTVIAGKIVFSEKRQDQKNDLNSKNEMRRMVAQVDVGAKDKIETMFERNDMIF